MSEQHIITICFDKYDEVFVKLLFNELNEMAEEENFTFKVNFEHYGVSKLCITTYYFEEDDETIRYLAGLLLGWQRGIIASCILQRGD